MNIISTSCHGRNFRQIIIAITLVCSCLATTKPASAQDVWIGGGSDANWQTGGNWQSGNAPTPGDSLTFTGATGLNNTNNFLAGTAIGGLTFAAPAGAFVLYGKAIDLAGNITNQQVVTPESINLPMDLTVTPIVDVTSEGVLVINGILSGGGGLTTVDGGLLNLTAANTFTGPLSVDGGTVTVSADNNLGAVPGAATPGSIILNNGALDATTNFTLNAKRGIAVGSAAGGLGTVVVDAGYTLTYGGIIAGNGGSGGLAKSSFGGLTLSAANTYTGPTIIENGTLTLDFTQAGSPANNIITSASALTLGGQTAGVGQTNNSSLIMNGMGSAANSQTFNSTLIDLGGQVIQANSGASGSANLALGALTHNSGGTVVIVPPANGTITTTSANTNGILGAWATIGDGSSLSGVYNGTNFATVGAGGVITNYNGYFNWSSGNLAGQVSASANVLLNSSTAVVIPVATDNSSTTVDVNAIKILNPPETPYSGIFIGTNNILRLGQYGGILVQEGSASGDTQGVTIGGPNTTAQTGNGASQDYGTLTAGGAANTPGEINVTINNGNETSGTLILEAQITDNGTGPVKFVKAGAGPMKLDGINTFSGGLYILQGRVQFAGSEIGSNNPSGGGTGPIYVYPGAEFYPSGTGTSPITNAIYISGNGVSDGVGAIRLAGVFTNGIIHLIGDSRLGGGATNGPIPIYDQITGNYNIDFGATGNSGSKANGATLYNTNNNWTGNTSIVGRSNGSAGSTWLYLGANNVIPNGFGNGNLIVGNTGVNSANDCALNMNGFNQTVNGLISAGIVANDFVMNGSSATSTLTVGNNDQSGTFAGRIIDGLYTGTGTGKIALTKIGGGIETLTASNSYSGSTTVTNGTLALTGSGSIAKSAGILVQSGAILDVSGETNFTTPNTLSLVTNGELFVNSGATIGTLNMTNGRIHIASTATKAAINATNLTLGGITNYIDLATVGLISGYPVQFPVIQYSGSVGGTFNFGLGKVPSITTTGYVSNNVANGTVDVVLLSGPESLTWTAANGDDWDIGSTTNWVAFGTTPSTYQDIDSVIFNDTAASGTVNITQSVVPGFVEVSNNVLAYTFTGDGGITGAGSMVKLGTGTLILDNAGDNTFSGGFTISTGTVQMGNNDTGGSLPTVGGVEDDSSLVFNRSDNLTVGSAISGAGSVTKNNADALTLSGNNSFAGILNVTQGILIAGSGTALGATNGATIISSGAALDINGQTLGAEPVTVSGTGISGTGAIVNSGPDNTTALINVTLAGDTTFGGTGRWDIRGTGAQLSTSGNAYNLTKVGTNQVSLVGITVDGNLANINVMSGVLSVEETSTLGNSGDTLTVASGATLQLYAATATESKQFVFNGDGATTTLNCGSGTNNTLSGNFTLNGSCIFNAASGTAFTLENGTIGGNGSMTKIGTGTNILSSSATANYTGGTIVSNGMLIVDGNLGGAVNVYSGATLSGNGTAGGNLSVLGGTLAAGDGIGTLTVGGNLALSNATVVFQLSASPTMGDDKMVVDSSLSLTSTNILQVVPQAYMNVGDTYTLITYGGSPLPSSATNNLQIATSAGFTFSIVDPGTTPGAIEIKVLTAIGNDTWTGQNSGVWDTSTTNWSRSSSAVNFNNGDFATFDDSSTVTNVSVSGVLQVGGITMNNNSEAYHFGGIGSLTGSAALTLAGSGGLIIANNGSNTFSGLININSGTLQVGDGGTNGTLGSGVITNNNYLVFNRSDAGLMVPNVISGSGSLTNIGNGTVTLAGANNFGGSVTVQSGTVRTLNSTALGNSLTSYTYVNSGATLDIGTNVVNLGAEPIYVSGAGVGGNGAIINSSGSSTFVGPNMGQVFFQGDTTVGGSGRIDLRASSASANDVALSMSPLESPYTLTKVGTNQFQISGAQIDPGLGNIDVQGGILGFQWQTQVPGLSQSLGDPTYTLHLHPGTTLNFYDLSNALDKILVMDDSATVYNQHGTNVFTGPITLNGTETFEAANPLTLTGSIGGNGNLLKTGASTLLLSTGPETYTGNTYVGAGTLVLTDVASLSNSPSIVLTNATIDVSGRTDGTLTLGAAMNQTLAGGGIINGILVENPGSIVNPGNNLDSADLTVSNAVTLNGSVILDLDQTNGAVTNDEIIAPSISSGGTLTVTNLGPDLLTGAKFQLFSVAVSGTPTVNLPAHNAAGTVAYTWTNNITKDGSITLLSGAAGVSTVPTNIVFSVSSGNLTLSWPADHTGWTLQAQTNSLSIGLSTNWAAVPGSTTVDSMTLPITTTNGSVFYRLMYQP